MTQKNSNRKVKWLRTFFLVRYPDGKYVSLTSHQTSALPKPVEKEKAYLFTPSKAQAYMDNYSAEYGFEKVPVTVYLE